MTCEQARDLAAAYVLGALESAEEAAVRDHLLTCDQPHEEFAELGAVVPVLGGAVELVEPRGSLRDRIMAAAAADLDARRIVPETPESPAPRTTVDEGRVISPAGGECAPRPGR